MKMDELIEKVRDHPVLYNTGHPDYMKKTLKDAVWQRIAAELNYEHGEEVKMIWLKLRNCHRDALRRKDTKHKLGTSCKPWKYERQMDFLREFMNIRLTNLMETLPDPEDTEEVELPEFDTDTDQLTETMDSENGANTDVKIGGKKRKNNDVIKRLNTDDELYHFYMSMYEITKQLPLSCQIKVKRKIFDVVTEQQEVELCSSAAASVAEVCSPVTVENPLDIDVKREVVYSQDKNSFC